MVGYLARNDPRVSFWPTRSPPSRARLLQRRCKVTTLILPQFNFEPFPAFLANSKFLPGRAYKPMNSGSQLLLGRHVTGNDGNDAISVSEVEKIRINKLEEGMPDNTTPHSYEMATRPPAAMSWGDYSERATKKWTTLLSGSKANQESAIRRFLEQHPALTFPRFGTLATAIPLYNVLISQPVLNGIGNNRPDFLWVAFDSATMYLVFVEIETPKKRWFTKQGIQHSDMTHAQSQLADWRCWFKHEANRDVFSSAFFPTNCVPTPGGHSMS